MKKVILIFKEGKFVSIAFKDSEKFKNLIEYLSKDKSYTFAEADAKVILSDIQKIILSNSS